MPALTEAVKTQAAKKPPLNWLGPPLTTLREPAFDAACARLMHLVESGFRPTVIVGIRTGGLVVARAMARAAASDLPVLPVTCQRASTATKSRLPWLRPFLSALPEAVVDALRRLEHQLLIMRRAHKPPRQTVNDTETAAIAEALAGIAAPRVLIADDAVDSGTTLLTVLRALRGVCPPGTEFRTAVITQTQDYPAAQPDYALYRGVLCRFPWSFDAARG